MHLPVIGGPAQRLRLDVLFEPGLTDELAAKRQVLAVGDHPSYDALTEDVDQDVEVTVRRLLESERPGDVPRPCLVGGHRHKLGLWRRRDA